MLSLKNFNWDKIERLELNFVELFGLKCEMCLREVKGMLGVLEKMSVVFYRGKKGVYER